MQNDIIGFVDIRLQSAEQTRLYLKTRINSLYSIMCECGSIAELDTYHKLLIDLLESSYFIGLVTYSTKVLISEKVNYMYKLRSNSFKDEFKEEK